MTDPVHDCTNGRQYHGQEGTTITQHPARPTSGGGFLSDRCAPAPQAWTWVWLPHSKKRLTWPG